MRLIDADALITEINERIKEAYKWYDEVQTDEIKMRAGQAIATFCEASLTVKNMPTIDSEQKMGKWITCSERLPKDIKPVLVTWKNTDPASYYQYIVGKHFIGTAHYHHGKWYWYSSVTEDLLAEYGKCESEEFDEAIEAIAWMPLPEPYKEDIQ